MKKKRITLKFKNPIKERNPFAFMLFVPNLFKPKVIPDKRKKSRPQLKQEFHKELY